MKLLKSISLFCIYSLCMLLIGFYMNYITIEQKEHKNDENEKLENGVVVQSIDEKQIEESQNEIKEINSSAILKEAEFYYLKVENHYITVYESDGNTIYIHTDITLDDLPEKVKQEIIDVKLVSNTQDLYDFLEAYSS